MNNMERNEAGKGREGLLGDKVAVLFMFSRNLIDEVGFVQI